MKLGGVTAAEAALALVEAFGYRGGVNVAALREPSPEPPVPMELDWDDVEAATPVFVGGYRESAAEPPPTIVDPPICAPGTHVAPSWYVSGPRAILDFLSLS